MEAVTYFQSWLTRTLVFSFKNQSLARFSKSENRLAHDLTGEGRGFAAIAEKEMKNGSTAWQLAAVETDENLKKNLSQIACWHYTNAARRYRVAADEFGQAARIWRQTKRRQVLEVKAGKMIEMAQHSESAVKILMQF